MSTTLKIDERARVGGEQLEDSLPDARGRLRPGRFLGRSPAKSPAHSEAVSLRSWLLLFGLTGMFVVAALWRPPDEPELVLCPFRALTHLPCPGCGMTRAFCALAHFEFWRAIKFNALSPLLFIFLLIVWARSAASVFRLRRLQLLLGRLPRPTPSMSKLLLGLVLIWWTVRLAAGF